MKSVGVETRLRKIQRLIGRAKFSESELFIQVELRNPGC